MADDKEPTVAEKALAAHGASLGDLDQGQVGGGNKIVEDTPALKPKDKEPVGDPKDVKKVDAEGKPLVKPEDKKPDDKKEKTVEELAAEAAEADKWKSEYVTLDDPYGQAAIDILKEAKVSPVESNAIFEKAIASGKLEDVDWATLKAKVTPAQFSLIKVGVENYYAGKFQEVQANTKAVHEVMGGESNWIKVRTWFQAQEKTDPKIAKQVAQARKALDIGGDITRAAAEQLRKTYEAANKNSGLGTDKITTGTKTAEVVGALGRAEYLQEMHKLTAGRHSQEQISALRARRKAGMAAGIP